MKLRCTLLMAAFSLLSALISHTGYAQAPIPAAKSTSIKISALPFNIAAPGTYVLTRNLTSPVTSHGSASGAINISVPLQGDVILDFKGFTITGQGGDTSAVVMNYNGVPGNTYRLTIRNGTLTNFGWGVIASSPLSVININNVVFNTSPPINGGAGRGVRFLNVNSSSVNNCTFNGSYIGIEDLESQGGNSYNNDSFSGGFSLYVSSGMVLERCQFAPPPSN